MKFKILLVSISLFALSAQATVTSDWAATPGRVFRASGDPGWWQTNWGVPDAQGNYSWRYNPGNYIWVNGTMGVRMVIIDSNYKVPYIQKKDGSWYLALGMTPTSDPTGSVTPPPPPPPISASAVKVLVVPLLYDSAPSTDSASVNAYNQTIPKLGQAQQTATYQQVASWWSRESYGKSTLAPTVTPLLSANKPSPGCNFGAITADATALAKAAGYDPAQYDRLAILASYSCWQAHWVTAGHTMISWNMFPDNVGHAAHEMGHSFGMLHSAAQLPPNYTYVLYGSEYDIVGAGGYASTLTHFNAYHKATQLQALTPMACADTKLAPLETSPSALKCGVYWVEYHGTPSDEVWIHKQETIYDGSFGGSDNTHVATLKVGQTWTDGSTLQIKYLGSGQVSAHP